MSRLEVVSGDVEVFEASIDDSWKTSGLIILISEKVDGDWHCRVSASKDIKKRIPQLPAAYPAFNNGKMILVRSKNIPLSDNELDWLEGLLFTELKDTDLTFVASPVQSSNTLHRSPEKIEELKDAHQEILLAFSSEGYSIESKKYYNQAGYIGELNNTRKSDRQKIDFGGAYELVATLIVEEGNTRVRMEMVEKISRKVIASTVSLMPDLEG